MEYYSSIKRNKTGSFVVMWMNLKSVIQSKVSQKEKNKYCILLLQCTDLTYPFICLWALRLLPCPRYCK